MPVTLAQAKLNVESDIDLTVIDEFRKSSWLFDNITFDDAVSPSGGATLTYGYMRLITQPTAAFRAINAEYTPQEVTKQQYTVDLKPFGGSFQIDRLLNALAAARETALQMGEKIKAAKALFNDTFINGDVAVDVNSFDGMDKALTGTATEDTTTLPDWTIATEDAAFGRMDNIDSLMGLLDGPASAIIANKKALAKIRGAARRAGYFTRSETAFGTSIEQYNNIVLIDPGTKPGTNIDVIPVTTVVPTGLTDVYVFRLGMDGLHAVSLAGQPPIRTWLPDFSTAGAVKTGEVEMAAAIALRATKAAAVMRNVKVA